MHAEIKHISTSNQVHSIPLAPFQRAEVPAIAAGKRAFNISLRVHPFKGMTANIDLSI